MNIILKKEPTSYVESQDINTIYICKQTGYGETGYYVEFKGQAHSNTNLSLEDAFIVALTAIEFIETERQF